MKNSFINNTNSNSAPDDKIDQNRFPGDLFAANGSLKGEVLLQWDAVKNANRYIIELTKNKLNGWEQVDIVNDSRYSITGLRPGKNYLFRVAPVFSSGIGQWSEPVSKKVK